MLQARKRPTGKDDTSEGHKFTVFYDCLDVSEEAYGDTYALYRGEWLVREAGQAISCPCGDEHGVNPLLNQNFQHNFSGTHPSIDSNVRHRSLQQLTNPLEEHVDESKRRSRSHTDFTKSSGTLHATNATVNLEDDTRCNVLTDQSFPGMLVEPINDTSPIFPDDTSPSRYNHDLLWRQCHDVHEPKYFGPQFSRSENVAVTPMRQASYTRTSSEDRETQQAAELIDTGVDLDIINADATITGLDMKLSNLTDDAKALQVPGLRCRNPWTMKSRRDVNYNASPPDSDDASRNFLRLLLLVRIQDVRVMRSNLSYKAHLLLAWNFIQFACLIFFTLYAATCECHFRENYSCSDFCSPSSECAR